MFGKLAQLPFFTDVRSCLIVSSEQPPSKDLFQTIPLDELVANSVEGLAESMVQRESEIISQMHVAHPHVGVTADPNNTTAAILKNAYDAMLRAAGGPDAREASIFYGQLIAAYVSEATNRVFGIALSGASPGQQFDILLQAS